MGNSVLFFYFFDNRPLWGKKKRKAIFIFSDSIFCLVLLTFDFIRDNSSYQIQSISYATSGTNNKLSPINLHEDKRAVLLHCIGLKKNVYS